MRTDNKIEEEERMMTDELNNSSFDRIPQLLAQTMSQSVDYFNQLPNDIKLKIYEYDSTYRDNHNKLINHLEKIFWVYQSFYEENESYLEENDIQFYQWFKFLLDDGDENL